MREIARVTGMPKVINQVYQESPERILEVAQGCGQNKQKEYKEFSALYHNCGNYIYHSWKLYQAFNKLVAGRSAPYLSIFGELKYAKIFSQV